MSDLTKLVDLNRKRAYISKAAVKRKTLNVTYFGGQREKYRLCSKKAIRAARRVLCTSLYTEIYITRELDLIEYYDE